MADNQKARSVAMTDLLDDPATSFALRTVIIAWSRRDAVDAVNDAERLLHAFRLRLHEILSCPH